MEDVTLSIIFRKSDTHEGYDLLLSAGQAAVTLGRVPTVQDGLSALLNTLTSPVVDTERLAAVEDAVPVVSEFADRIAALEQSYEAVLEEVRTAKDAMIGLLAQRSPQPAARPTPQPRQPIAPAAPAPEDPGYAIPGFAGTFRRPLEETVHAGPGGFEGGPFRRSTKLEAMEAEGETLNRQGGGTLPAGGVVKRG